MIYQHKKLMLKFIYFLLFSISTVTAGEISTGIGYLDMEDYRIDNEINPLPLGWSTIPFIAYRSKYISFYGPNVTIHLLRGPISFSLNLQAKGDRYEGHEVEKRETSINAGAQLRLYFLSLKTMSDIFHTYNGNINEVTLGHRIGISSKIFLAGMLGYEYVNNSYVNYYYGVKESEIGFFNTYKTGNARNEILNLNLTYMLGEGQSLNLGYKFKKLDPVIFDSPTVAKRSFKLWNVFWSFSY